MPLTVLAETAPQPFFAFDNGVGRDQQWSIDKQASVLKELGYHGIGYSGTTDLAKRQQAFKNRGLQVFSLYVPCYPGKEQAYDPQLVTAMKDLSGTGTDLWLTVQGKTDDEQAVTVLRDLADRAAMHRVKIVLYPHHGFYVATTRDALRLVQMANRLNVGVSVNLCHELRAGNGPELDRILTEAAAHLSLVSINGADREGKDWQTLIQPLGRGDFDMQHFLDRLKAVGYTGPVGLQCYNVKGDPVENLKASMTAWRRYVGGR
jgi:sugar phosphate isomerase/epimerase